MRHCLKIYTWTSKQWVSKFYQFAMLRVWRIYVSSCFFFVCWKFGNSFCIWSRIRESFIDISQREARRIVSDEVSPRISYEWSEMRHPHHRLNDTGNESLLGESMESLLVPKLAVVVWKFFNLFVRLKEILCKRSFGTFYSLEQVIIFWRKC